MRKAIFLTLIVLCFHGTAVAGDGEDGATAGEAAAGQDANKPQEEIAKLVSQLGSEEWREREAASERLAEIGRDVIPALAEARKSEDAEVRERAKRILDKFRWIAPEDAEAIEAAVKECTRKPEQKVKPDTIKKLVEKLTSSETQARQEAQQELVKTGRDALPVLGKLEQSEKFEERDIAEKTRLAILAELYREQNAILSRITSVKNWEYFLLGKLAPGACSEDMQKKAAEVLSGLLGLKSHPVSMRANKIVIGDFEIQRPPGGICLSHVGGKVLLNGVEIAIPCSVHRDATPAQVISKLATGDRIEEDLQAKALDILVARKEKSSASALVNALKKASSAIQLQILKALSASVEDGPACPQSNKKEEIQKSVQEWQKWLRDKNRNQRNSNLRRRSTKKDK